MLAYRSVCHTGTQPYVALSELSQSSLSASVRLSLTIGSKYAEVNIKVMVRGRQRGLPDSIDRSVMVSLQRLHSTDLTLFIATDKGWLTVTRRHYQAQLAHL